VFRHSAATNGMCCQRGLGTADGVITQLSEKHSVCGRPGKIPV